MYPSQKAHIACLSGCLNGCAFNANLTSCFASLARNNLERSCADLLGQNLSPAKHQSGSAGLTSNRGDGHDSTLTSAADVMHHATQYAPEYCSDEHIVHLELPLL